MNVGILTIGDELTSGKTQDTNSSFIAREMNVQGWQISLMVSVGDDERAIADALACLLGRSEAVIVTGGLGPTADDITTAAIARAFGRELVLDKTCLQHIKDLFAQFQLPWTDNNAKQAYFPAGAETIFNPVGTAWGFSLAAEGKLVLVIPGVPAEVKAMLSDGVISRLRASFPAAARHVGTKRFKLFGMTEAGVDQALADIDRDALGVGIGFYPTFPEIHVVVTARTESVAETNERLARAEGEVLARIGEHVFACGEETLEGIVAALLTERKLTLAVAESLTGGLVTDRLTDIPGSSVYLERAAVTYSNASKTELLGVPEEILARYGAVSEETAVLMAQGMRRLAGTDLGLATTGIAGPAGGSEEKPVGTVYVALCDGTKSFCRRYGAFRWDRRRIKLLSSQAALLMVQRYLTRGLDHDDA